MNSGKESYISVRGLTKAFDGRPVLKGIDLDLAPGELTVLIGPSGCGKSTLLRCLNGLEIFDTGSIRVGEVTLEKSAADGMSEKEFIQKTKLIRSEVGMVFQSFNLFPHLRLLENLTKAPMVVKGMDRQIAEEVARKLLDKVGLSEFETQFPEQLSGGQQQRAAIARALALFPKAMLYDEPTSALDPTLVDEVLRVLRNLDDDGMTQIVVTHEMRFAKEVSDNVVFMDSGRVVEYGPSDEVFSNPKEELTRQFLRNFL